MDYVLMALIILLLVLALYGVNRWDAYAKKKYKMEAYKLLDDPQPDAKQIRKTITGLRIYEGRWRKDQECQQLAERLHGKYTEIWG